MKFKIIQDISSIELHDSSIVAIDVLADEAICITFDWAKITNFKEQNLGTVLLGKCSLRLNGIKKNKIEYEKDNQIQSLKFSKEIIEKFDPIGENKSRNDNELSINTLLHIKDTYVWITWILEFEDFEFSWSNHVTFEQWMNGKLATEN